MSVLSLLAIVMIGGLASYLRSPQFKGWLGETIVRATLLLGLNRTTYHVLHDVTLPTERGTTQIDHVVVSKHGVFVIETKNYSGWIFGSEREPNWTRTRYGRKQSFQNPLRQNYAHIHALIALTGLNEGVFKNVVVFTGSAELKSPMPPNVLKFAGLLDYFKSLKGSLLSDDEVGRTIALLGSVRLAPGRQTHRAHVEGLKSAAGAMIGQRARNARKALVLKALIPVAALAMILFGFSLLGTAVNRVAGLQTPAAGKIEQAGAKSTIQATTQSTSKPLSTKEDQATVPATRQGEPLRTYEGRLYCGHSVDTGRCACYDKNKGKVTIEQDACIELATKTQ
jgi:restriction system protein